MNRLFFGLLRTLPLKTAYAHCDIPCGIYDPKPAQIAAATVLKMVQLIKDIPQDDPSMENRNKFVRCVLTKEEHARKCKEEILILWTDYFKPEHFEKYPDLTDKIKAATKLCSENKQHIDEDKAQELVKAVDEIAAVFAETKK